MLSSLKGKQRAAKGQMETTVKKDEPPKTLSELKSRLDAMGGVLGNPGQYCETGAEYDVVSENVLARPENVDEAESRVAANMWIKMMVLMGGKYGKLYWRIPLEYEILNGSKVDRIDESGPDVDFETNSKCYLDRNWKRVAAYVRFHKAEK